MLLLAIDFDNLHQILQNLYVEMMPLCSKMTGVARGLAGLGALFYVAYRVWQALARAEPVDVFPLLRPFALGLCIMFFPTLVLGTLNSILSPVVKGTHTILESQTFDMNEYRAQKDKLETPSGNAYVNHAISYIQNHYSMPMKVEELSDYVGINRSYFSDLFKQYTGMSPVKYLQNFRITKAQHMLTISELSIESIAFSCGYQSAEAFHKIFRKTTGMSPNAYRQEKRQRTLSSQETVNNNRPDYIVTDDEL